MACLEVLDIPSAASTDDLGVLVAQFAPVLRMLLLSHGPGCPGSALVWVAGGDGAAVADALDSYPLAGGLISVRLCADPMRWVVSSVGTDQVVVRFQHPSPAQAAARAVNGQLVPELNPAREVQAELREREQPHAQTALGRETASAAPTTKLWVGHIAPEATIADLRSVFSQFGPIYAPELRRAPHRAESGRLDQWAFVNFKRLQDAVAAYAVLGFQVVPRLSGDTFLKLQYRPV